MIETAISQLLFIISVAYLCGKLSSLIFRKLEKNSVFLILVLGGIYTILSLAIPNSFIVPGVIVFVSSFLGYMYCVFTAVVMLVAFYLKEALTVSIAISLFFCLTGGLSFRAFLKKRGQTEEPELKHTLLFSGILSLVLFTISRLTFVHIRFPELITFFIGANLFTYIFFDTLLPARNVLEFADLATTDNLTGLYNRTYYNASIDYILKKAEGENKPVSFILLDIDHFKAYNDTWGHDAGDECLRKYAQIFIENTRSTDLVVRWGGEEFLIVLPETSLQWAEVIASRFKKQAEALGLTSTKNGEEVKNTLSMGITTFPYPSKNRHDAVLDADSALYKAKEKRNCIKLFMS